MEIGCQGVRKWKSLGTTGLKEIGWESVDWINLAEDRNKCRSLMSMVQSPPVS